MGKLYLSGLVFQGHDYFPSFSLHLSLTNQANVGLPSALRFRILMTRLLFFYFGISMQSYLDATYFGAS